MDINQLWAFTNKGAIDFLTMQRVFPVIVGRLIELETKVQTLDNRFLSKPTLPFLAKRTLTNQ